MEGKEDAGFGVALTGGTKIMSIAAYDYFIKDYNSKMLYIPLHHNYYIIPSPKKTPQKPVELSLRLNVIEYVTAYGLKVTNENGLQKNHADAINRKNISEWLAKNYKAVKETLEWLCFHLRQQREEKQVDFLFERFGNVRQRKRIFKKIRF